MMKMRLRAFFHLKYLGLIWVCNASILNGQKATDMNRIKALSKWKIPIRIFEEVCLQPPCRSGWHPLS